MDAHQAQQLLELLDLVRSTMQEQVIYNVELVRAIPSPLLEVPCLT